MGMMEVKKLFKLEFRYINMSKYERMKQWNEFINTLFEGGSINAKVFARCERITM